MYNSYNNHSSSLFLHYYQCHKCLSVGTNAEYFAKAKCEACQGNIVYLGHAHEDKKRLQKTVDIPACDGRCTQAIGPKCVCKCGCVNHGTGKVVQVIKDAGPVPLLIPVDRQDAIKRAKQLDEGFQRITAQIVNLFGSFQESFQAASTYVPGAKLDYKLHSILKRYLSYSGKYGTIEGYEAKQLRADVMSRTNHDNRIKAQNEFLSKMQAHADQLKAYGYGCHADPIPAAPAVQSEPQIIPASELVKSITADNASEVVKAAESKIQESWQSNQWEKHDSGKTTAGLSISLWWKESTGMWLVRTTDNNYSVSDVYKGPDFKQARDMFASLLIEVVKPAPEPQELKFEQAAYHAGHFAEISMHSGWLTGNQYVYVARSTRYEDGYKLNMEFNNHDDAMFAYKQLIVADNLRQSEVDKMALESIEVAKQDVIPAAPAVQPTNNLGVAGITFAGVTSISVPKPAEQPKLMPAAGASFEQTLSALPVDQLDAMIVSDTKRLQQFEIMQKTDGLDETYIEDVYARLATLRKTRDGKLSIKQ